MISNLLVNSGVDMLLTEWMKPQIEPLNKITFSKSDGHLQNACINVAAAHNIGTEHDPTSTDAGVNTKVAVTTTREMRSLLEEHHALLIQSMKRIVEMIIVPIMIRLQEIERLIIVMQEDLDNLTQLLWVLTCQAQLPPLSGLLPSLVTFPGQTRECWSPLANISGCPEEISGSIVNGQFSITGPVCCKAIMEIPDNCWSKFIPFNPVFPTLIRNSCARGAAVDPAPKGIEHVQARKPSVSGLLPLQPVNRAMRQCWSSLANVPGCLVEILNSLFTGEIGAYGAACCEAITRISDNCWTQLFPFNPFFPSLVIDSCAAGSSPTRIGPTMAAKHSSPGQSTLPFLGLSPNSGQSGQDIARCWSSLSSVEGCVSDIYGSLSRGQFRGIGTACCRAITDVNDICWPQMFPFNPLFPPLLYGNCASIGGEARAPTGI
ncbi:uncharacterized protein LOC121249509 [Juglans microcarpa x Juglans regia]|uniref:uncharacterized protein LOC121249509 n=1 Tax=Juglans microcarpa x Juglans regia TaxID=2249226 RepID=UPI001B7E371F|nr:uncharacterized protein LOC121249509 [Juglans microcarpa x Juglans regia]